MSTLAVFFEKEKFTIVNDSLSYEGDHPRAFTPKTKTFPHLRCAINGMGLNRLQSDFERFIRNLAIDDFSTLIGHIKESFFYFLELDFEAYKSFTTPESGLIGSLLVMGYSENEKRMSAHTFYLYINRLEHIEENTDNRLIFHPGLSYEDELEARSIASADGGLNVIESYLVELLKIMHIKYKNKCPETVPSGLEIHSTILNCEGEFYIKQSIPHRFPTFSQDFITILDNQNKIVNA